MCRACCCAWSRPACECMTWVACVWPAHVHVTRARIACVCECLWKLCVHCQSTIIVKWVLIPLILFSLQSINSTRMIKRVVGIMSDGSVESCVYNILAQVEWTISGTLPHSMTYGRCDCAWGKSILGSEFMSYEDNILAQQSALWNEQFLVLSLPFTLSMTWA